MDIATQLTILGRAALGAAIGFAIGLERESRGKSAGDRTFALLAFAAAAVVGVGAELGPDGASRVIQGVVTGVGFLGAGLIFRQAPSDVRGLTTAAGSWAATAIGSLAGIGAYMAAAFGGALVLVILELDRLPLLQRIREQAEAAAPGRRAARDADETDDGSGSD
jgi:putative Mg2+ transporter-C (MgtC) family protein